VALLLAEGAPANLRDWLADEAEAVMKLEGMGKG